ncbi:MAG: hypothetical protein ACL7BU_00900 [Candidatus Phlomobacter fragariae]
MAKKIDIYFDATFNETLKEISRVESLEKILLYDDKADVFSVTAKNILVNSKNDYYVK